LSFLPFAACRRQTCGAAATENFAFRAPQLNLGSSGGTRSEGAATVHWILTYIEASGLCLVAFVAMMVVGGGYVDYVDEDEIP
jgi:hypothetical protein